MWQLAQFDDHRERVNAELAQLRKQLTWLEKEIGQAKTLQHPAAQDAIEVGHVVTLQIGESGPSDYVLVSDFGGRPVGNCQDPFDAIAHWRGAVGPHARRDGDSGDTRRHAYHSDCGGAVNRPGFQTLTSWGASSLPEGRITRCRNMFSAAG